MADITYRRVKGAPLTNDEVDDNFLNLNTELSAATLRPEIRPVLSANFAMSKKLDSRFTVTRSTIGTTYDSIGKLVTVAANQPRFYHDPVTKSCLGLLVEEARTNLVTYSEDLSDVAWTKTNTTVTANAAGIIAPDGTATMDHLIENTANGLHSISEAKTVVSGSTYTTSAFVAAGARGWAAVGHLGVADSLVYVNLATGAVGTVQAGVVRYSITKVFGNAYRVSVTAVATSTSSGPEVFIAQADNVRSYTGDGTSGIYVWGLQHELGVHETTYIPSLGAAQTTRNIDFIFMTGTALSDILNTQEATITAGAVPLAPITASTQYALALSDNSNNNRVHLHRSPTSGLRSAQIVAAGVTEASLQDLVWTTKTYAQLSLSFKFNDADLSVDGRAVLSDTAVNVPTGITRLYLGSSATGSLPLNGALANFALYAAKLSDTEIQSLAAL